MPSGLWTPGALWQFRQNLRAPDHTGVRFVQSSTEPTTWQWEYVIAEADLPLVDLFPRGWQPADSYYDAVLNVIWQNTSGASRAYYARVEAGNATFGARSSTVSRVAAAAAYGYFFAFIRSVNVGTVLRLRLWAAVGEPILGLRLILVPVTYGVRGVSQAMLELAVAGNTPSVISLAPSQLVTAFAGPTAPRVSGFGVAGTTTALLTPLFSNWYGGFVFAISTAAAGDVSVSSAALSTLYSNGYFGVNDWDVRLLAMESVPYTTAQLPTRVWT